MSIALSDVHWTTIKLVAAWISGACFVYGFQLVQRIPRDPKASKPTGKRETSQGPSDTSWPAAPRFASEKGCCSECGASWVREHGRWVQNCPHPGSDVQPCATEIVSTRRR